MAETPDHREDFERHPDIRGLRGPEGPHHGSLQAKLDLFESSPRLVSLADVPIAGTLHIRSLSEDGAEEAVSFRRLNDVGAGAKQQWVLLRQEGDNVIEEPVNMFGACASPTGGPIRVR